MTMVKSTVYNNNTQLIEDDKTIDLSYYFDPTIYPEEPKILKRGRSMSISSSIPFIHQELCNQPKHTKSLNPPKQIDISIKEIKQEGLRALLLSSVPLGFFLYHLLNEYCSESLFFYLSVEKYQKSRDELEKKDISVYIVNTFLSSQSELEVNLEDKIYREIEAGKNFDGAKKHIFSLLNISYHRFRSSSLWTIMESELDSSIDNKTKLQLTIVNLLLSVVNKNKSKELTKLVYEFCKTRLTLGYKTYYNPKPSLNRKGRSKSISNESKKFITSKFEIFKLSKKQ